MNLPQLINAYYDTSYPSQEELYDSINTLFDNITFTDKQSFAREYILQEDAEVIALSNKYFISDYVEHTGLSMELVATAITAHPEHLAYHLAYSEPILATQLLEELLYYRDQGRI